MIDYTEDDYLLDVLAGKIWNNTTFDRTTNELVTKRASSADVVRRKQMVDSMKATLEKKFAKK